nr:MAG TPA: hypothetical protein [Caudoviricetes sp.]
MRIIVLSWILKSLASLVNTGFAVHSYRAILRANYRANYRAIVFIDVF